MINIRTYESPYGIDYAKSLLLKHDKNLEITDIYELYYPYMRIQYKMALNGKLGKIRKDVNVIVDLAEGRLSMGQGMPNFIDMEVSKDSLLHRLIPEDVAKETSRDFAFKIFLNKTKLLMAPDIDIEDEEIFHKLFYVVQCKDKKDEDFYILVDSIEGKLIVLDV